MASSPPSSPNVAPQRPMSAMIRPPRSQSRMSSSSRHGGGSRASDEDGKTSVKVAVRVRPPLKPSDPGFELIPQRFQRSMVNVTTATSLAVDSPQGRKLFVFDRVFSEKVDQEGVWEYIKESVNAFVQGYNVSVLAYGQSGAGKSYTMGTSGPAEQNDSKIKGVIPRAANELFERLNGGNRNPSSGIKSPTRFSTTAASLHKQADKTWALKATYVEIYNEQLRDLLVPEHIPMNERSQVSIREDAKGRILLTGLHSVTINSIDDLLAALNFGSTIRQTDATAINAKSSRSHAVFSLNLVQRKNKNQTTPAADKRFSVPLEAMTGAEHMITVDSKLHFVDLAGSERLKNTGAQGERAKEGISINAGLASLGKVISQLSTRSGGSHVSYRDSKLTRLLQDSLGGNAITYMIACVTPAEFHLSETLNTVQYAQRARAIQSKPQIQQVQDDGDKVALIERLRAEVAFLREQIRNSERTERRSNVPQERAERQNEKEIELQNRLLDVQESYGALSQRHAKLISEIAKARDVEDDESSTEGHEDSAVERLKRSNAFAEAVEKVVMEYEKTIESLETSLSSTRSSLSATESSLLEKETKCAYIETVNQQLQARVHKMMDRESSTENYLHDLEAKLDGHTSGEEKNAAIVIELRKEIARVRENEASCEDYISTLEERLAEADQDVELMQREIDRLEHVVERQRSLGKLDNLLYELDHIQQDDKKVDEEETIVNGKRSTGSSQDFHNAEEKAKSINGDAHESEDEEEQSGERAPTVSPEHKKSDRLSKPSADKEYPPQSPAQSKFVQDKLENVTQELFELRVDHENTRNDYDLLAAKYEEALRTLAELQDTVDEARHPSQPSVASTRPTSFLEDARMDEVKDGEHISSSRSLSSELFSAGASQDTTEASETGINRRISNSSDLARVARREGALAAEMENLRRLHMEKEDNMNALAEKYAELEEQHNETLDYVEELKAEVQKVKLQSPTSPTAPVIRRKSSQNVMIIDRAHRSFASLRNIATENFEDKPDVMQNFELNLNAAMHELHSRSERVQELEADIASVRKEMETKMTIISGLTRERSSMKNSSPMDMSVVSSMRDQLVQSEHQIRTLQENHAARERDLLAELDSLMNTTDRDGKDRGSDSELKISQLQDELSQWEDRHKSTIASMHASEQQLLATITELESKMDEVEAHRVQRSADADEAGQSRGIEFEEEKASLQKEIDQHKTTVLTYQQKVAELEQAHGSVRGQLEEAYQTNAANEQELSAHRLRVAQLEQQLTQHKETITAHEKGLKSLQESNARDLSEMQSNHKAVLSGHLKKVTSLESELDVTKSELNDLLAGASATLGEPVHVSSFQTQIQAIVEERDEARRLFHGNKEQLGAINAEMEKNKASIKELSTINADSLKEIERLNEQNKKSARLVDELEEQLSANFDQHVAANKRLSALEAHSSVQVEEAHAKRQQAETELEELRAEIARLQSKMSDDQPNGTGEEGGRQRSSSITSNLRKSASVASLPSPPPAIPLPPLPNTMPGGGPQPPGTPTGSRHPSKDLAGSQLAEDQEARIRTIEKHLFAEKQLTSTLEEALVDLETQGKKVKEDLEHWKKKAWSYEDEIEGLKNTQKSSRFSMQAVEEERNKRKQAEAARTHLEERMNAINKKKKKGTLNCF